MSEWKECKLEKVAENFAMGPFGSNIKAENFQESGVPVIRGTNLNFFKYIGGDFVFLSEEKADQLRSSNCFPGDLVFTHRGTIGQVGIVPEGKYQRYVVSQSGMKLSVKKEYLDNQFLFYFFKSSIGQHELLQNESQVGVPSISSPLTSLKSVTILLPPLPEQHSIASILSSLDDKIDMLHRQNKTLEALAETLFRQWFVEEAGEGWGTGKLRDVIEMVYGKALKEDIRTGKGFPVVGSSGIVGYHSEFLVEGPGIVIGRKGTLGKVIYLFESFFPIDTTYFIKSKVNSVGLFYEYFLLKTLNFEDMNTDSAVPGLNREIALSTEIKIAPFEKLKQYNDYCASLFGKLKQNNSKIRTLARLRDTLLPKLMSGELRVKL